MRLEPADRTARRDIWRGELARALKESSLRGRSKTCRIKGNISHKGVRIYRGSRGVWSDRTPTDPGWGERWFCSEREARDGDVPGGRIRAASSPTDRSGWGKMAGMMNSMPFPKPPPADPLPIDIWLDQTDRAEVGREPFFRGREAEYGVCRSGRQQSQRRHRRRWHDDLPGGAGRGQVRPDGRVPGCGVTPFDASRALGGGGPASRCLAISRPGGQGDGGGGQYGDRAPPGAGLRDGFREEPELKWNCNHLPPDAPITPDDSLAG